MCVNVCVCVGGGGGGSQKDGGAKIADYNSYINHSETPSQLSGLTFDKHMVAFEIKYF